MSSGTCRECGMIYTATPEQRTDGHTGECDCVDCGKTVLERTGFHSFSEWEPFTDESPWDASIRQCDRAN